MKFYYFTIEFTEADVELCREAIALWHEVPTVSIGANRLQMAQWSKVGMSLDCLVSADLSRRDADALARRIYRETNGRTDDFEDRPDAFPSVVGNPGPETRQKALAFD